MQIIEWISQSDASEGSFAYESWFGQIPRISALCSWSIRGTCHGSTLEWFRSYYSIVPTPTGCAGVGL